MSVRRTKARWAQGVALAALLAAPCARADELDRPAVTPLDLAPPAALDLTPTGALPKTTPAPSRLDLSPPPGLMVDLPPEAAPAAPVYAEAATASRVAADAPTVAVPAQNPPPPVEAAAPAPEPAPAVAEAKPETPPPVAAPSVVTPDAVHAALDAWLAKPAGRPVGMADGDAARRAVAAVYAERAYAPLWVEADAFNARARAALARLAHADDDGLRPPPAPAAASAEGEIALSASVVAYAMQASGARINPRALSKDVTAAPPVADPAAALKTVAEAADPDTALEAFNPPHPEYRALREALAALRARRAAPSARLTDGPALKLGMSDPRVPLIRARFGLGAEPDGVEVYDVRVASAVAAFQRVHGLPANGMLTSATAQALGGGEGDRERQILANMEMWRWLPRDLGATRVEVNVADFSLKVTRDGEIVHRARAIVGKPDTPTPVFSNSIRYLLVNPAWHVPDSIIKKEMAPKAASDPNYFARHGYKVTYVNGKMEVEQPPGEANALGRILFMFPNEHAVYLHDTPQRGLFAQSYRALSHGCVRVEDPAALAELLMGGAKRGWTAEKLHSLLGDKERTYPLPAPVPVHLEYFTLTADAAGDLQSHDDLYGLTGKVISALQAARRD